MADTQNHAPSATTQARHEVDSDDEALPCKDKMRQRLLSQCIGRPATRRFGRAELRSRGSVARRGPIRAG
jgi:hypothetical protein